MILSILSNPFNKQNAKPDLSFQDISFLTFEAVLEVVIICFAGFIAAKSGLLTTQGQKVISQLNVDLFTPCLVFTKLAPSLSFSKMADIVIIPVFYALSTGISYLCSRLVGSFLSLNEPESDFVTAMAVFGNSNSLPVSLTMSLAYTLPDLLWDDIDDDNSDKVASRGILYLLIFQQLGQILRWSWGYNKLLRKRSQEELNTYNLRNGEVHYHVANENIGLLYRPETSSDSGSLYIESMNPEEDSINKPTGSNPTTPLLVTQRNASSSSSIDDISSNHSNNSGISKDTIAELMLPEATTSKISEKWAKFRNLPVINGFLDFMNPPLYAMLISVIVASVPFLQNELFNNEESFIHNTLTNSINQLGSVSIPLILIVLGSNLYPSKDVPPASRHHHRILLGSLLSRMILPSIILLPIIALCVKFIKISILDDPIFLIVAFILTVSPPAIQLSQIIQINNIYQKEMAGVLFWGYVILTLPTTIFIVATSLEVLKWATK